MGLSVHPRASSVGKEAPSVVCHPNTAITRKFDNPRQKSSYSRTKSRYSGGRSGHFSSAGKEGPSVVCHPNTAITRKFDNSRKNQDILGGKSGQFSKFPNCNAVVCQPNTALTRKFRSKSFSSAGKGPAVVCRPNTGITRKL